MHSSSVQQNTYFSRAPEYPQPSAPNDEPFCIDWNSLPPTRPLAWHEDGRIRRLAGNIFLSLGTLSAGATVFSATLLVASSQTILMATGGFALLATASFATGIVFHVLKSSPMDPSLRLAKRLEIRQAIERSEIPCYEVLKTHLNGTVLTAYEIDTLLKEDLSGMGYFLFIEKHGEEILNEPSLENLQLLKSKYLQDIVSKPNHGIKYIINRPETKQLGFKEKDIILAFIDYEVFRFGRENTSYGEFISRNGHEAIAYVKGSNIYPLLVAKFQNEALNSLKGKGAIDASQLFAKDFLAFGGKVTDDILQAATEQLLQAQTRGAFDYQLIRQKNDMSHLKKFIKNIPEIFSELRQAYLKMPCHDMNKYRNDQVILKINPEEIKKALKDFWKEKSLHAIISSDEFFATIQEGMLAPSDWTDMILSQVEGIKVKDLISLEPRLFTLEILKADTILPSGQALSQTLEEEINHYITLESLLKDYSEVIFNKNLCSNKNPRLQKLALHFIYLDAESCIAANDLKTSNNCLNVIETYQLLPNSEAGTFDKYKKWFVSLKNEHTSSLANSARQCQSSISQEERIRNAKLKENIEAANIQGLSNQTQKALQSKNSFEHLHSKETNLLNSLKNDDADLRRQIDDTARSLQSLQNRLGTLPHSKEGDLHYWKTVIAKKTQFIVNLDKKNASDLTHDPEINRAKVSISELEKKISEEKAKIALKDKYETLLQEKKKLTTALSESESRKKILIKNIQFHKQQRDQTQGLVNAIRVSQSPLAAYEKELEGIEANEKKLEHVNDQIEIISKSLQTINPATLSELELSLSEMRKKYNQAFEAVEGRYNISQHKHELAQLQSQQRERENAIAKKKSLQNEMIREQEKFHNLTSRKAELQQAFQQSSINAESYERQSDVATHQWKLASSQQAKVEHQLANCQEKVNADFNAQKRSYEEKLEDETRRENESYNDKITRLVEDFKGCMRSKWYTL